jgi:hypothetical protein
VLPAFQLFQHLLALAGHYQFSAARLQPGDADLQSLHLLLDAVHQRVTVAIYPFHADFLPLSARRFSRSLRLSR